MEKNEKKSNKLIFVVIGLLAIAAITTAVVLISGFTTVTFDTDGGNKIASVRVRKGKPVAQPEDAGMDWSRGGEVKTGDTVDG